jgi:hypothetical protein
MRIESVPDYKGKSDDELLRLELDADSLTTEAKQSLLTELKERKLDSPRRLAEFKEEQEHYKHLDDINLGNLELHHGTGRHTYGRYDREVRGTSEEYDTTLFAVVFFFPLIPMAAYRMLREQGSKQFRVLDKRPLDWSQVALVWLKAVAILVAIPYALDLFLRIKQ